MSDVVRQTVPLGRQWPTIDPFLFCVHHDDTYPAANERLGPDADLSGRELGQDFAGRDGWNMYHGLVVPGFPSHPHRGFETVTFVRDGLIDHADSLGAAARYGGGDVQWLTAGGGIQHAEMFPLLARDRPNPIDFFQIWLNLPSTDKMVEAHFAMLWDRDIPRVARTDRHGRSVEVTVVAGSLDGHEPPAPPPSSWAARPDTDVAIWHIRLDPDAVFDLPAVRTDETVRTLYVHAGDGVRVGDQSVAAGSAAVVSCAQDVELTGGAATTEILMLQGRPIGEPVVQYGPFVMNDRRQIDQALADYQRTRFGGWPWPSEDLVHGPLLRRFARHADGVEDVAAGG